MTCDNASPNDVMIDDLPNLVPKFSGVSSHTRCFNHVVALVVVRIVRQFDIPKDNDDKDTEAEKELRALAKGLDIEDIVTQRELEDSDEDDQNDDGTEGWAEERAKLSAADRLEHDDSVRPVRMLLVKVGHYFQNVCPETHLLM